MDVYAVLLVAGAAGIAILTLLGFGHGHGHDGDSHAAHGGHGHHGGTHHGIAHGAGSHAGAHAPHGGAHSSEGHNPLNALRASATPTLRSEGDQGLGIWGFLLSLASPLTVFSVLLGAGFFGVMVRTLDEPLRGILAFLAGIALNFAVVRPLIGMVSRFASAPAEALEGSVARGAIAEGRFDAAGQGVVRVTIDGELVRVLARLDESDMAGAETIRPGDELTVTEVDATRNRVRVARF